MTVMYQLPVYMPGNTKADPIPVMYGLPSFHANNCCDKESVELEIVDPAAQLEKRQQELIKQLQALNIKLDTFLKAQGTSKDSASKEKTPTPAAKPAKNDKDAKKEARKAAKAEAKNKVNGTGGAPAQKAGQGKAVNAWVIQEDKLSTETGQSLTSCTKQTLANFKQEAIGDSTLTVEAADLAWVQLIAKIAESRNVAFTGAVTNKVKKSSSSFTVKQGDKFSLVAGALNISRRVPAWKLIGSALGIFSFSPEQSINSTHQHLWLQKADGIINKLVDVDYTIRNVSQFLSSFDGLGVQYNLGIADIVLRSLFPAGNYSSNVELWAARIESL